MRPALVLSLLFLLSTAQIVLGKGHIDSVSVKRTENENGAPELRFRADGTFKILQFTDLHFVNGNNTNDTLSCNLMNTVLDAEQPDMVAFTGDQVTGFECGPRKSCGEAWKRVMECAVIPHNIPYTFVYGNHDDGGDMTKQELMDLDRSLSSLTLAEPGPSDIHGLGNYVVKVLSSDGSGDVAALLYHLDSGTKDREFGTRGFGWIRANQVAWYRDTSNELIAKYGKALPALAFFHIPLNEYDQVYFCNTTFGVKQDEDLGTGFMNSGFYDFALEQGDVYATFAGHAHQCDYHGLDYDGKIEVFMGRSTGFSGYGSLMKGVRVIQIREGERKVESWMHLADGTVVHNQDRLTPIQISHDPDPGRCYFKPYPPHHW